MRKILTTYRRSIAAVLLILFAAYYLDVNCFVHSHVVNGVTIVHSHLHKSSHHASNDGGHSVWQFSLIAHNHSQFHFTESVEIVTSTPIDYLIETIGCECDCYAIQEHGVYFAWRAPPMATILA